MKVSEEEGKILSSGTRNFSCQTTCCTSAYFFCALQERGNFPFILIRSYNFVSAAQTDTPPLNLFRTLLSADKLCKKAIKRAIESTRFVLAVCVCVS